MTSFRDRCTSLDDRLLYEQALAARHMVLKKPHIAIALGAFHFDDENDEGNG
jgi:hypothetical protein